MSVKATGILGEREVTLELVDGTLTGDTLAVQLVRRAISTRADVYRGVASGPASLENDWIAAATFEFVLPGADIEVDAPVEDIPEGAIP